MNLSMSELIQLNKSEVNMPNEETLAIDVIVKLLL